MSELTNELYDWDGTIIPRISGNAKAYMVALKDLKAEDVTHHGKGKTVDLATARPPMFHRSIRETCKRLGIDVGEIHHAPGDKVETVRRLGRPIVDDNPEIVDAVRKALGVNMAKEARWTSRIADMLASGQLSQEKFDWISNRGLPFYSVRAHPRIVDYNKRAIQARRSPGDLQKLKQNITDALAERKSYRGTELARAWRGLCRKPNIFPISKPNRYSTSLEQVGDILVKNTFKDHWGDQPILVQAPADSEDKFSTHLHSDERTHAEGKTVQQLSAAGTDERPTVGQYNYGLYNNHPLYESTTRPERTLEKLRNSSVYAVAPNGTLALSDMPTAAEGSMYKGFAPITGDENIGSLRNPKVYTNSPTWWSGLPEVSARYADKSLQGDLSAARLTRIGGPAEMEQFITKLKSNKPNLSDLKRALSEGGEERNRHRVLNSTIRKVSEIDNFKGENNSQFANIMQGLRGKGLNPNHVLHETILSGTLGPKLPDVIPRKYELSSVEALARSLGKKVAPSPSSFFKDFKPNLLETLKVPVVERAGSSLRTVTGLLGKLFRR